MDADDRRNEGDDRDAPPELGAGGRTGPTRADDGPGGDVPDWDDYLDRVSDRLTVNYDLERDYRLPGRGESFDLYGQMRLESHKRLVHPALNYANHASEEHLFVRRREATVQAVERHAELGHALADEWIDADEEHFSTDFTFVIVAPDIPEPVRAFVSGFEDRTLLKWGYYGHYEVNLVVVAPESEEAVASESADVARAFVLWRDSPPGDGGDGGPLARLVRRLLR